jgi:predicted transcriptional regulator
VTADQYRAALTELGLSQLAAGRWLGVSKRTAQNYATEGPSPPAARAIRTIMMLPPEWRDAALADAPE